MIKLTPAEARQIFREMEENETEREHINAGAEKGDRDRERLILERERVNLAKQREARAQAQEKRRAAELDRQAKSDKRITLLTVFAGLAAVVVSGGILIAVIILG